MLAMNNWILKLKHNIIYISTNKKKYIDIVVNLIKYVKIYMRKTKEL